MSLITIYYCMSLLSVFLQLLKSSFSDYDLSRMPSKISELRGSPPTAWSKKIEQTFLRSMTFSEFETISHPLVLLNVASSTDTDPVRCMQELSFVHHTPSCISSVSRRMKYEVISLPSFIKFRC